MNPEVVSRIRRRLRARGLGAYVASSPSSVFYTTGFQSYFLTEWWRWHGSVMVVIPTDEAHEPALMISDFEAPHAQRVSGIADVRAFRVWVELRDASTLVASPADPTANAPRPAQFDDAEQDAIMHGILTDRRLTTGRIGADLRSIPHHSFQRLCREAPQVEWVDFTDDIYAIRSIKLPFEVDRLRRATELSEAGMQHASSRARAGLTATDVRQLYMAGILATAVGDPHYADYTDQWILPAVGSAVGIGVDADIGSGLREGDLIKFDCGVTVGGYRSDGGRTFCFERPTGEAERLYDVLHAAHDRATAAIEPGVPASTIFGIAQSYIRGHGYPSFTRGHYGHSLGIDTFHEEPPYIAADDHTPLEVDMVLAIETPAYSADVGAIMIEDLIHLKADGIERLHRLPRELRVVG